MDYAAFEQIFHAFFADHTAVMFMVDPHTQRLIEVNARCAAFYGYTVEQMRGMPLTQLNTMGESFISEQLSSIMEQGKARDFTLYHRTATHTPLVVKAYPRPITLGGKTMLYTIIQDITHEQQLVLDHERRQRELDEFMFIASHTLQEPLRKVTTLLDRFKTSYTRELEPRGHDLLERVSRSVFHMSRLIEDLLKYTQLAHGRILMQEVDLRRLLEHQLTDMVEVLQEHDVMVHLPEQIPLFEGDTPQIMQLFQELFYNAIKYRLKGAPLHITLRARLEEANEEGEEMVEIALSDNGIGFAQRHAQHIFLPFHRLHGPKEFSGTGIGLAICRKIVELHRGTIEARGIPGEGATFIIRLPTYQPHLPT